MGRTLASRMEAVDGQLRRAGLPNPARLDPQGESSKRAACRECGNPRRELLSFFHGRSPCSAWPARAGMVFPFTRPLRVLRIADEIFWRLWLATTEWHPLTFGGARVDGLGLALRGGVFGGLGGTGWRGVVELLVRGPPQAFTGFQCSRRACVRACP